MSQSQLHSQANVAGQVLEQPKPTLKELRAEHWFGIPEMAALAEVAPVVVAAMLDNRPVYPQQAYKVLFALSKMNGRLYTVRDVDVALYPEQEEQEQCRPRRPYRRHREK
jgi:hypothetical protein